MVNYKNMYVKIYFYCNPPVIGIGAPLIYELLLDAKNAITSATSSGFPIL